MTELAVGLTIGLAAGMSPGPLQTLVVTSALTRGFGAGWRVAVAPLLTDIPIVVLSILAVSAIPGEWLNGLAVLGGLAVVAMAVQTLGGLRHDAAELVDGGGRSDVLRGAAVNALSPHPWVFWIAAGGPLLVTGWRNGAVNAAGFLLGFYVTLVGSKVVLAWVVGRGRRRLSTRWRRRMILGAATLLAAGGAFVAWQGATGKFG